jgi:hypothetical protein
VLHGVAGYGAAVSRPFVISARSAAGRRSAPTALFGL